MTNFAPAGITGEGGKAQFAEFAGRDGKSSARVAADTVVFAIGQAAGDIESLAPVKLTGKGTVKTGRGGKTSLGGVFAAGDVANGGKTVVEAVAEGKEAAAAILAWLEKKGVK
jgi:dihydropyrimidine dehydrogenase (NAD+) subunit PreT